MIVDLKRKSVNWKDKDYAVQCERTLSLMCDMDQADARVREKGAALDMLVCDGFAKLSLNNNLVLYRSDGNVDAVFQICNNVWEVNSESQVTEVYSDLQSDELQQAEWYLKDRALTDGWVLCGDVVMCKSTSELHVIAFLPASSKSSFKSINVSKYDQPYRTIRLNRGFQTHFVLKSSNKNNLISYKFSADPENIDGDERQLAFVLVKMEAR